MSGKRAYQHEMQQKKVVNYTHQIKTLITRTNLDPFGIDYSSELEKIYKANPKDRGIIRLSEQEAYIQARQK